MTIQLRHTTSRQVDQLVLCRHNLRAALKQFFGMLAVSIPVLLFTPVIASFGTLVIPNLTRAVFVFGEHNGRSTGDAPLVLYVRLAWLIAFLCLAVLIMNLIFGVRSRYMFLPVVFGSVGFATFLWSVITEGGALWQWDIVPLSVATGFLTAQGLTTYFDSRHRRICWSVTR
jgi:hypothetical protein